MATFKYREGWPCSQLPAQINGERMGEEAVQQDSAAPNRACYLQGTCTYACMRECVCVCACVFRCVGVCVRA
jgi:hypothetical protein